MEKIDSKSGLQSSKRIISWSKNGSIAYYLPNRASNLFLTYLENINGKTWQLASPQEISVKPNIENLILPELNILEWSNLSTDLGITDIYGNFYIMLSGVSLVEDSNVSGVNSNGSGVTKDINHSINISNTESNNTNTSSPNYELTSYNHLEMIYKDITVTQLNQRPNQSAKIIGLRWLPIEKPQVICKGAKINRDGDKQGSNYSYGVSQYQPKNVCHPISTKQACIVVRANGELILYYQGEHKVDYYKQSIDLTSNFAYNVKITHSEFGFPNIDDGTQKYILLVTYDELSNKIRSYRIMVNWGFLVESAYKQRADPHYSTPKDLQNIPKITVEIMHEMPLLLQQRFNGIINDHNQRQEVKQENGDSMLIDSNPSIANDNANYEPKSTFARLSTIQIISPLTSFEREVDVVIGYDTYDENFKISSFLARYRITRNSDLPVDAFKEIGDFKGMSKFDLDVETSLVLYDQACIADQVLMYTANGNNLTLLLATGEIIHLDRSKPVLCEFSPQTGHVSISCLQTVGFKLPSISIGQCPIVCGFSPLVSAMVYFETTQELDDLQLVVAKKEQYLDLEPQELNRTSAAFAYFYAISCYMNMHCDDILIVIQQEIERVSELVESTKDPILVRNFIEMIICESHKAINFQLDSYNKESVDKLLSNPPLQRLLSLQLLLIGPDFNSNNISLNIAWILLNLRSTSFGIMFSLSSIYRQISKKKPSEDTLQDCTVRAEAIISLTGNVRWLVELIIYLNQEMLELHMSGYNGRPSKIGYHNSIVLPILLSRVPRLFLMYALSSLNKTQEVLKRLNKDLIDANKLFTPMKDALNRYFISCSNSPLNINVFENFIREADVHIIKEMNNICGGKLKGYALKLEQQLVCHGKVDESLFKMGRWVIDKYASFIARDLKVAEMYYYDVDWLSIGCTNVENEQLNDLKGYPVYSTTSKYETVPRQKYGKHEVIDSLRKIIISADSQGLRKCTRCRSMSLINDPLIFNQGNIGLWTMVFQRTCICGGSWVNI